MRGYQGSSAVSFEHLMIVSYADDSIQSHVSSASYFRI
jgi:hypothetical protein